MQNSLLLGCTRTMFGATIPSIFEAGTDQSDSNSNQLNIQNLQAYGMSDVLPNDLLICDSLSDLILEQHAIKRQPRVQFDSKRNQESTINVSCHDLSSDESEQLQDEKPQVGKANVLHKDRRSKLNYDFSDYSIESIHPKVPNLLNLSRSPPVPVKSKTKSSGSNSRFERLQQASNLCKGTKSTQEKLIDLEQLRRDSWLGIPNDFRPQVWKLLSGHISANLDMQTVNRKRNEYWQFVEDGFHTQCFEHHQDMFRQIQIDIPRMASITPLFRQKTVQMIFERVLYVWSIRHPASGYVQGMNDLLTPFFVVFLSEFVPESAEAGDYDIDQIARENIEIVEADSFWCFTSMLDTIQDNYTPEQPGIQRKINELEYLLARIDADLTRHLLTNQVEVFLITFRWMNNILMREIPLSATIRLWDTYLSEQDGFSDFHVYVCAAFLRSWSKELQAEEDLQGIMLLVQNLPTQDWSDQQICELTADAYSLMRVFYNTKRQPITLD